TDVAPARETEEDTEDAEAGNAAVDVEPNTQHADEAEEDSCDHCVEAAQAVGDVAWYAAAEDAAGVEDREELVGECWGNIIRKGVGGDIGQRHEQPPFDKKDACCCQCEGYVFENAEIGPDGAAGFGRQAGTDEEVCDDEEDEEDECEEADGPGEPEAGKKRLEGEREDDAAEGAACCCEAGCGAPATGEEMGDGADGWGKDEGGADAAKDGEGEEEMPVFWDSFLARALKSI
ncbi:MAG: hypothetical protein Q9179_003921, partial [Wetmoreana sp. 5 TL-2023]